MISPLNWLKSFINKDALIQTLYIYEYNNVEVPLTSEEIYTVLSVKRHAKIKVTYKSLLLVTDSDVYFARNLNILKSNSIFTFT